MNGTIVNLALYSILPTYTLDIFKETEKEIIPDASST